MYCYKSPSFRKDLDIQKVFVSKKISFGKKKNNKYFIGYLYSDHKFKSFHIVLPETSAYIKGYDGETKWLYFWLKMMTYYKNIVYCLR